MGVCFFMARKMNYSALILALVVISFVGLLLNGFGGDYTQFKVDSASVVAASSSGLGVWVWFVIGAWVGLALFFAFSILIDFVRKKD